APAGRAARGRPRRPRPEPSASTGARVDPVCPPALVRRPPDARRRLRPRCGGRGRERAVRAPRRAGRARVRAALPGAAAHPARGRAAGDPRDQPGGRRRAPAPGLHLHLRLGGDGGRGAHHQRHAGAGGAQRRVHRLPSPSRQRPVGAERVQGRADRHAHRGLPRPGRAHGRPRGTGGGRRRLRGA
ncbi:MAG: hypothetical protein AVDCRST_MAG68-2990, partial [uncultured Gemmatimonadetes bacterium]